MRIRKKNTWFQPYTWRKTKNWTTHMLKQKYNTLIILIVCLKIINQELEIHKAVVSMSAFERCWLDYKCICLSEEW